MIQSNILIRCLTIIIYARTVFATSLVLDETDNKTAICAKNKCIPKCCQKGDYMIESDNPECGAYSTELNFYNITIYDDNYHNWKLEKVVGDIFHLVPGKMYEMMDDVNATFVETNPFISSEAGLMPYLSESGNLYVEFANSYNRWILRERQFYCVDFLVNTTSGEAAPEFWVTFLSDSSQKPQSFFFYYLIISSMFLVIVLLVYIILPELRNLGGMILMAYVTSLLGAFVSLAVMQKITVDQSQCINMTAGTYFFFLATFCWMNVMSVDIWWTFRGYAKARPIHRRGEPFKFGMYCIYAWGTPMAMTIFLVVMNESDLSDKPWIIKPMIPMGGCFLEEGQKWLYLYIPMLILILFNWLFYLLTAYNIRRLMRGTAVLDSAAAGSPAAHRQQRNRLMVYLKLSVIMGINWVLEVVSSFTPTLKIWLFTDTYNLLIGFAIFLIFVCKKKIFKKLKARFHYFCNGAFDDKRRPTRTLTKSSTSSSTLESNLSQEIPLQVSTDPMPNEKRSKNRLY